MSGVELIGLAGNAFQFIEFAFKLYSNFQEICQSTAGHTEKNARELKTTEQLQEYLVEYSLVAKGYRDKFPTSASVSSPLERTLQECQIEAKNLRERLKILESKAHSGAIDKLARAIRAMWQDRSLKELKDRLAELRVDLVCYYMPELLSGIKTVDSHQAQGFKQVIDIQNSTLQHIDLVPSPFRSQGEDSKRELAGRLRELQDRCIRSLSFPVREDRQNEISSAQKQTFEWIFKPPNDGSWDNFVKWLGGSEEPVYWVNGKAGSGKSTLMKHIAQHACTKTILGFWAGETRLITASYFFWNSGSRLQRSQEGLLRALLYSILLDCPELVPVVLGKDLLSEDFEADRFWTRPRLARSWNRLTSQTKVPIKLCLFVDGLDEYEGESEKGPERRIARLFTDIARPEKIKFCVSSRPHNAFEEAFGTGPKLALQDLTANDILEYVRARLIGDRRIITTQGKSSIPKTVVQEMATLIQGRASGVFLWVTLVVETLLDGLQNGDKPKDLKDGLKKVPEDLEHLFEHMLDKIPDHYRE